jgi:Carboxypeptidase regulatory-like domain/TonB dependent receptor
MQVSIFPGSLVRLLLLFLLVFLPVAVMAQNPRGALRGAVEDATGARVAGAKISVKELAVSQSRDAVTDQHGEFRLEDLSPGSYRITVNANSFAAATTDVQVVIGSVVEISVHLRPAPVGQTVSVEGPASSITTQTIDTASTVHQAIVTAQDLERIPLANRSFANIAYMVPGTEPVEPSDPTKARITAVAFGGSSGLNVDLSVDGGDNNDDYIGGFLQNYSPDAMQEFTVRTAQFDADTSRTNGGSVVISTKQGTNDWHGGAGVYYRNQDLNARNPLDNPAPNPKQPFSRENFDGEIGGPLVKDKLWLFSSFEYINEDASVGYSALSLGEFNALAQLASSGQIPGVTSISVPTSVGTPFHDTLSSTRLDFAQSQRSHWFLRGAFDLNQSKNDLVHEGALPSTGFTTTSHYYSVLLSNQFEMSPEWIGKFVFQASGFHHEKLRNSNLGFGLAFPFSTTTLTTSGFETFGDNQFVTPITAFPVNRDQQKYQFRYDVAHSSGNHAPKFGINFIHEPVLSGRISDNGEILHILPENPSVYVANPGDFATDFNDPANQVATCDPNSPPGQCLAPNDGRFRQNVQRVGFYVQDSWHARKNLTINYGLRYDTTFGLFDSNGANQDSNPAVLTVVKERLPLLPGVPHDYRKGLAPRLGIAWSPGAAGKTVLRAGAGMYYNDLAQNGWVDAFRAVAPGNTALLGADEQGAMIDPRYHAPYAIQASAGFEQALSNTWKLIINYEHQQGVHQYRRYEYISQQDPVAQPNATLPDTAPNLSVFRTDNRSRYDGLSFAVNHSFSRRFSMTAHYTLAKATTWGATVGELFDYVNGVSNVNNPFGPGDHGPSGEDVRHRFVLVGTVQLPGKIEVSTLSQFESGRPYTLSTGTDINGDGAANDRAVINGVQTTLDQFRGTPFAQVDLRVSRSFRINERLSVKTFAEFFNLFNRQNPGNNYIGDIGALPVPATEVEAGNVTHFCLDAACNTMRPITLNDVRQPAGALGDFFGPGTTVGMPFAAQFGVRFSF